VRDEVLLAAGFIPETTEQRDAAVDASGDSDKWDQKEIGEPAQGERRLFRSGNICRQRS
jgi:hypothetical protein